MSIQLLILCCSFSEFLNTWNDFPVLRNKQVTDTVLVLYSVSMLQFSVVTTKTTDEYVEDGDDENFFSGETTKPESGSAVSLRKNIEPVLLPDSHRCIF